MQKSLAALVLSTALAAPAFAADSYTIDPNHTFPVFEVNHLGLLPSAGASTGVLEKSPWTSPPKMAAWT